MTSNPRGGSHLAIQNLTEELIRITDKERNNSVMCAVKQRKFERESDPGCQERFSFLFESRFFLQTSEWLDPF